MELGGETFTAVVVCDHCFRPASASKNNPFDICPCPTQVCLSTKLKVSMHGFCRNFQHYTGFVYYLFFSFQWVLSFLYVYSDHSILECYNLFSGVELSMRSFFVISVSGMGFSAGGSVVPEVT